jgi:hypothetical protein
MRAYPVMTPRQRGYAELEAGSARILEYGASIVPGLLQTPEYARLRIESAPPCSELAAVDVEVAARVGRQAILSRSVDAPHYEAIVDEQAVTGRGAPDHMRVNQIGHLAGLASLPNVTIRVLRTGSIVGPHFVPYTGFSIYRFIDPGDPETVVVETLARELVVNEQNIVARYVQVFGWLRESALDPDRSRAWLEDQIH